MVPTHTTVSDVQADLSTREPRDNLDTNNDGRPSSNTWEDEEARLLATHKNYPMSEQLLSSQSTLTEPTAQATATNPANANTSPTILLDDWIRIQTSNENNGRKNFSHETLATYQVLRNELRAAFDLKVMSPKRPLPQQSETALNAVSQIMYHLEEVKKTGHDRQAQWVESTNDDQVDVDVEEKIDGVIGNAMMNLDDSNEYIEELLGKWMKEDKME
eukprot:CAMPEP_0171302984 /NCGR_PEP_ID=MMETSP0816-20121228/12481_1 /TAXON_ID=420281 /ORGANISM="Proboscia inermis, Strain CCAP1064/1" /LENGTH=216 /DNA_ID=CAMNT_0011781909 /DNA_START=89 /DNA_END=739 /DNA_ORIENTATION=+